MCKATRYKVFVLLALVFCLFPAALAEDFATMELNGEESYAMNLFLSNFTEVGVEKADIYSDDRTLVDFAHDHMWFNDHEAYEYGEYFGGNNCRVSDDRIQSIIDSYFYHPPVVDPGQTRFDYDGEYYYHCETGGWASSGFAHTLHAYPVGEDKYFVSFMVFNNGDFWENDVLDDDLDIIIEKYNDPVAYGSALVYAEALADRSSYKIISYSLV